MSDLAPMLRLDVLSLKAIRRNLLLFLGMALFFAAMGGMSFAMPLLAMSGVMSGMHLFGVDESNRLRSLYGGLPVRRRTVLLSHYLVGAGVLVAMMVSGVALVEGASLVKNNVMPGGGLDAVVLLMGVMLLVMSVQLPLVVVFGVQRATWASLLVVSAVAGAALAGGSMLAGPVDLFVRAGLVGETLVLGVGAALYAASYLVAVRLYERQDH